MTLIVKEYGTDERIGTIILRGGKLSGAVQYAQPYLDAGLTPAEAYAALAKGWSNGYVVIEESAVTRKLRDLQARGTGR